MTKQIGINIGSCYAHVGIWNGSSTILSNEFGNTSTPCTQAFNGTELVSGEAAENEANAFAGVHAMVGKPLSELSAVFPKDLKLTSAPRDGEVLVEAPGHPGKNFSATDCYVALLKKAIKTAGTSDLDAVCTVSPSAPDKVRQAVRDAGVLAGLNVLRIVNAPTMVAVTHGMDKHQTRKEETMVIFDLGGNKLELTRLTVEEGCLEVQVVVQNNNVGGTAFDQNLLAHCLSELKKPELASNPRVIRRLTSACRRCKCELSTSMKHTIEVESLFEDRDFSLEVSRGTFDKLNAGIYAEITQTLNEFMTKYGLSKSQVDYVIMTGGSSRIPYVQSLVAGFFGLKPMISASPEHDACLGATIQAQILASWSASAPQYAYYAQPGPRFWRSNEAGLYANNVEAKSIPLEAVEWNINIIENLMELTMVQTYVNSSSTPIEAIYVFPIEEDMAVSGLTVKINDKVLEARIKERNKAEGMYQDAVAEGNTGYLMTYDVGQKDILRLCVGNLAPGKKATIQLSLNKMLTGLTPDGSFGFTVPASFVPKYQSAPAEESKAMCADPLLCLAQETPYTWKVTADLACASKIVKLLCSHGAVAKVSEDGRRAKVEVAVNKCGLQGKDFMIEYKASAAAEPKIVAQKDPSFDHHAAAITFCPEIVEEAKTCGTGEYIFVLDCSGSMYGTRIEMAKAAAKCFLRSIPANSLFNVYLFGSTFRSYFPQSVPISNTPAVEDAIKRLGSVYADMEGTELYKPLADIFSKPVVPEHPRNLFLITDGAVSDESGVIGLIKLHKGNTRVHTFGIGNGVSTSLIKNAAKAGNGHYEFLLDNGSVAEKVLDQLHKVSKPALSVTELKWPEGWEVLRSSMPNTVYSGEPFTVLALCRNIKPGTATITAVNNVNGKKTSFSASLSPTAGIEEGSLLYKVAARRIICDYDLPVAEEVAYATRYNVLSENTAFIVVEKLAVPASGELKTVKVPLPEPSKYSTKLQDVLLLDVAPLSLGVEGLSGVFVPIISRNSTIPSKKSAQVKLPNDPTHGCSINIYEGERALVKDNNKLEVLKLPTGGSKDAWVDVDVTFDLDCNGILTVSAVDQLQNKGLVTISNDKSRLSRDKIDELLRDAEKLKAEDQRLREVVEAKNTLEAVCYKILRDLLDATHSLIKLESEEQKLIREVVDSVLKWLEKANLMTATRKEFSDKLSEMDAKLLPVLAKAYARCGMQFLSCASLAEFFGLPSAPAVPGQTHTAAAGPRIEEVD